VFFAFLAQLSPHPGFLEGKFFPPGRAPIVAGRFGLDNRHLLCLGQRISPSVNQKTVFFGSISRELFSVFFFFYSVKFFSSYVCGITFFCFCPAFRLSVSPQYPPPTIPTSVFSSTTFPKALFFLSIYSPPPVTAAPFFGSFDPLRASWSPPRTPRPVPPSPCFYVFFFF